MGNICRRLSIALALLSPLVSLNLANTAQAATIAVNTTTDELNTDGDCSLREAISAANSDTAIDACTAGSGADTITVPAGTYQLTIEGSDEDNNATGDLDILSSVTLQGAGRATTIIDAGDLDRVLDVRCEQDKDGCIAIDTVTVKGFTLRNGTPPYGRGGVFRNAGDAGQSATGPITLLEDCIVSDGNASSGGGIGDEGKLTIRRCKVQNNTATIYGGGIDTFANTVIEDSEIVDNSTRYGGGIANNGKMVVRRTLIANNTATDDGGGFLAIYDNSWLTNVTITGNTATAGGGGLSCGNEFGNDCNTRISHSTIAGNTSADGGGIKRFAGTATLRATIIADNTATSGNNDVAGAFVSSDYNLIELATGATGIDGVHDVTGVDPALTALADNGGYANTLALDSDSAAIDAAVCTDIDEDAVATDARGYLRPETACDVGAFEVGAISPDPDFDGILADDNCPSVANPDQADGDDDGVGDVCDNCPDDANDNQADDDDDGVGNACTDDSSAPLADDGCGCRSHNESPLLVLFAAMALHMVSRRRRNAPRR